MNDLHNSVITPAIDGSVQSEVINKDLCVIVLLISLAVDGYTGCCVSLIAIIMSNLVSLLRPYIYIAS